MQAPPDIDLVSLRWSAMVARSGGFRRAAEALGVEQSALSRRVRRLEDELGVSLFQRSTRGAAPTNAGEVFLRRIDGLLSTLGMAVAEARSAGLGQVGQLRIGMSFSVLSERLFDLIARFHKAHPKVRIEMVEGRAKDHLEAIADRRLDIAVLPGGMSVSGLDISVLWREALLLALPFDHPRATDDVVHLETLGQARLLFSERDVGRRPFADIALRAPANVSVEVQEAGALLLLDQTRMGLGFAVLASGAQSGLQSDPRLVFRPLAVGREDALAVAAAWSAGNDNPVLRRFVSAARSRTAKNPG